MIPKYKIICNEGTSMWDYTEAEPLTRKEIIDKFWDYEECRTTKKSEFSLRHIKESWNVTFERVN